MSTFKKLSFIFLFSAIGSQATEPAVALTNETAVDECAVVEEQTTSDENRDNIFDAAARERLEKELNKTSTHVCMGISKAARWTSFVLLASSAVLWGTQKIAPMVSSIKPESFLTYTSGYPLKMLIAGLACGVVSAIFDKRKIKAQIAACDIHEELKASRLSLEQKRIAVSAIIDELIKQAQHQRTIGMTAEQKEEFGIALYACLILKAQFA